MSLTQNSISTPKNRVRRCWTLMIVVLGFFLFQMVQANADPSAQPRIDVEPADREVLYSDSAFMSVGASGQSPLRYQWFKDGGPIAGAVFSSYNTFAYPENEGTYFVVVSNDSGSVTSRLARLTVIEPVAPYFLNPRLTGLGVARGSSAELSIAVRGREPLFYQWFRTNAVLAGETNATLRFSHVGTSDYGDYALTVWNEYGSATASITLGVFNPNPGTTNVITVPKSFAEVSGEYNGLYFDTNGLQHGSSGFFTARVRGSGGFSGRLRNGNRNFSFSGAFDLEGKATNQIARREMSPLTVVLSLDLYDNEQITGTVSEGTWTAQLMADRAGFSRANPAGPFATNYTIIIPGSTNAMVEPAGDGFGTVRVRPNGSVIFRGALADGSPGVTQRVPSSRRGDWPLYVPLYRGHGSLLGWLALSPLEEVAIAGRLNWLRPPSSKPNVYANGFRLESVAMGSTFSPISTGRVFSQDTARVVLSGGNLAVALTNLVDLSPNGRVTYHGQNKLTLTVRSASGLLSGKFKPADAAEPIPFRGVLLQRQSYGGGFFLGPSQSGRVFFSE
jgi:hypothetical protein